VVPAGAAGCVLMVPPVLPIPVLPPAARSLRWQLSRSAPIMFSHRLRPPIADGGVGEGKAEGDCEGVTAGVCDGVVAGVWEGVMPGVLDGVPDVA